MEKELKNLFTNILANQVVIYKRLEEIEHKIKGGSRLAGSESYVRKLQEEAEKYLPYIKLP